MKTELIDTLWNVNNVLKAVTAIETRINRYIMECKSVQQTVSFFLPHGINRYIMECK